MQRKGAILLKRVYENASTDDGFRVLVERLWPRGISKERGRIDLWFKEIAPSPGLRAWYGQDVQKWEGFQERYRSELRDNPALEKMQEMLRGHGTVIFVFAARDEEHNSASVLKGFLEG